MCNTETKTWETLTLYEFEIKCYKDTYYLSVTNLIVLYVSITFIGQPKHARLRDICNCKVRSCKIMH